MNNLKKVSPWIKPFQKMLSAKLRGRRIPLRVEVQITKFCNLRCVHCYTNFEKLKSTKEPTTKEWKSFIDELYGCGTRWLRFLGGEPLMRDDIGELIDYAHNKGMVCDLNTNGYFLQKKIKNLKNLNSICISIDGDEEVNDKVRGRGCYKKIIEAIEVALENDLVVRLHGVLMRYTMNSIEHLLELARRYKVTFNISEAARPDMSDPNLLLTEEERIKFYHKFIKYKIDGWPILNSITAMKEILNWPFGEKRIIYPEDLKSFNGRLTRCQQTITSCIVDTDGRVSPCTGKWGEGLNSFEEGFKKAWDYLGDNIKCITCLHLGYIELSKFLSLDYTTLINALKKLYLRK